MWVREGTVKRCLSADVAFAAFDVHSESGVLATCAGTICFLWDVRTFTELGQLGRSGGGLHKRVLRFCRFSHDGQFLVTGGDDTYLLVWDVSRRRSYRKLTGHRDAVFAAQFSQQGKHLFTSGADGKLLIWDWRKGVLVNSFVWSDSAILAFDMSSLAHRLVIAGSSGRADIWDMNLREKLGSIDPDTSVWQAGTDRTSGGWINSDRGHTGGLLAAQWSPDGMMLATASTDHTCKVWDAVSFLKTREAILRQQQAAAEFDRQDQRINLSDSYAPRYVEADVKPEKASLKPPSACSSPKDVQPPTIAERVVDAVTIPADYQGVLICTLKHEASVVDVAWSSDSRLVLTSSRDATVKIWRANTGELVFQINTPMPVLRIHLGRASDTLYCLCGSRLLVLRLTISSSTHNDKVFRTNNPLKGVYPDTWHPDAALSSLQETSWSSAAKAVAAAKAAASALGHAPIPAIKIDDEADPSRDGGKAGKQAEGGVGRGRGNSLKRSDLQRVIAQGALAPSFLTYLTLRLEGIDGRALQENMRRYNVSPAQVLRSMVNSQYARNYAPQDFLSALAAKDSHEVFNALTIGAPLDIVMRKRGVRQSAESEIGYIPISKHDLNQFMFYTVQYQDRGDRDSLSVDPSMRPRSRSPGTIGRRPPSANGQQKLATGRVTGRISAQGRGKGSIPQRRRASIAVAAYRDTARPLGLVGKDRPSAIWEQEAAEAERRRSSLMTLGNPSHHPMIVSLEHGKIAPHEQSGAVSALSLSPRAPGGRRAASAMALRKGNVLSEYSAHVPPLKRLDAFDELDEDGEETKKQRAEADDRVADLMSPSLRQRRQQQQRQQQQRRQQRRSASVSPGRQRTWSPHRRRQGTIGQSHGTANAEHTREWAGIIATSAPTGKRIPGLDLSFGAPPALGNVQERQMSQGDDLTWRPIMLHQDDSNGGLASMTVTGQTVSSKDVHQSVVPARPRHRVK